MTRPRPSLARSPWRTAASFAALASLPALGCGGGDAAPDAAQLDAGPTEDAPIALDAPAAMPDAARDDAPFFRPDSGPSGSAILPLDACDDDVASLYLTPDGLSPFTAAVRGELLGCSLVETISAADVATRLSGVPDLVLSGGDVRMYVIAYRTEREPRGVGGISTALVFLPDVAYGARVPMVLAAHGTIGIADECAPSRFVREGVDITGLPADYIDALLLSYAARGLPVVAPDYAGLGTEGTHAYDSWLDPARSAIDGVRALRALLPSDRLDGTTIAYGHSQGGGIVLALAGLRDETPDVDLRAIVSLAPGYRVSALRTATALSSFRLDASLRTFASLAVLAGYANLTDDTARWGDPFRAGIRDHVVSQLTTLCIGTAITALDTPTADYTPPTTIGEALDPEFTAAVSTCSSGGACDGLPGAWVARDIANEPRTPASSPPILLVVSNGDTVNLPRQVGCAIDRVEDDGASPELCVGAFGDHLPMVAATAGYTIDWALGIASGGARPLCPGTTTAPRCSLF